ncbi:hypothetical protein [Dorea longicatena]|uniref:hypothetical protein n=1 Tax=Dorea longicatena TaxID=88431 RepID=UPI0032C13723
MTYTYNHNFNEGGTGHMMKAHKPLGKHSSPHERKALIHIDFSDDDMTLFKHIYGDDDEAVAAIQVLMDAPPEIQIIAAQLISLIEEVV